MGLRLRINYFGSPMWVGLAGLLLVFAFVKTRVAVVTLALVAGMMGMFFRIAVELKGENYLSQFYNLEVVVGGVVGGDPETDENTTNFKLINLQLGAERVGITGTIYVSLAKNEQLARGDQVVVSGKLAEGFGTYAGYLYKPVLKKWERPEPGDLILKVRNWFAARVRSLIPEPEVELGVSYLMGMKTGLDEGLEQNLRVVGLVHIVVASGAHLSILVEMVRKLLGKWSRLVGLILTILVVLIFMSMVGWTASILRAGLMAILTLLAWYEGRQFAPWRIILIVMALTLMLNPVFVLDLGWLLSFASYAGIMVLGPKLTKFFYGEKKPGLVASMVVVTVAATLMTLPIILYYYGTMSLLFVVTNLLILPTLPYAMGLVFLTGAFAGVPVVEVAIAFLAKWLLDFHIIIVEFFGGMRQFLIEISPYNKGVFLIYGLIGLPFVIIWLKCLWYNQKYGKYN